LVLKPQDQSRAHANPSNAELSRPKRAFVEKLRQDSTETRGRKRKHEHTDAVRTNWKVPHLWQQINAEFCNLTGPDYSIALLVRELQKKSPEQFSSLTPQVVGRWIDWPESADERPQWKADVLKKVGFFPGGQVTRCGILVCALYVIYCL
jgi:hypothetical protein